MIMRLQKKWIQTAAFLCVWLLAAVLSLRSAHAAPTVFELRTVETVTKGVTYESVRKVTEDGLLDVYILKIPVDDPNLSLGPLSSTTEHGLKETLTEILNSNEAIAGVNGDFFGMAGNYSASFGPEAKDGKLLSISSGFNNEANEFASFYIGSDSKPFILYLQTDITFTNNGKENIKVFAINKVTDMVMPIIVNRNAMDTTESLDARFKGLLKVVVKENVITYVSRKGETVEIPENGYVLVISEASADYFRQFFEVGHKTELNIRAGVDFSKIQTSIGGAGRILLNGEIVHDSGTVISGRQPRTAVGITEDKSYIILMTVDGRSHSIGATHEEMAELLLQNGAYNAMHLDGGGSSTMAVRHFGDTETSTVNAPSDGSERKIMNALGLYNTSGVGSLAKIVITAGNDGVLYRNVPELTEVYGTDAYGNRIEIPRSEVVINTDDPNGFWEGDYFYPSQLGTVRFLASYGNYAAEVSCEVRELAEIRPSVESLHCSPEETVSITFTGIDTLGLETFLKSGVQCELVPASLGSIEAGQFKAADSGSGYIRCFVGSIATYIPVQIGGRNEQLDSLDGKAEITFSSAPAGAPGGVRYTDAEKTEGSRSLQLRYHFEPSDSTQAAYANFNSPYSVKEKPVSFKLSVFGNNSNLWLRGRITDAEGKEFPIDFANKIDWTGWKNMYAVIPEAAVYPVTLDRVYVVLLSSEETMEGEIYLDNLTVIYPEEVTIVLPESSRYTDRMKMVLGNTPPDGSFDITILGNTVWGGKESGSEKPASYDSVQSKLTEQLKTGTKRVVYGGATDYPTEIGTGVYKWNENYVFHEQDNAAILQMCASEGGFMKTNLSQWGRFPNDIARSTKDHYIIVMDKNPMQFSQKKEFELFHDELARLRASGKNIVVVSTDGLTTSEETIDGIRYINIGGLWDENNNINSGFRILRFRISGSSMTYDLQEMKG